MEINPDVKERPSQRADVSAEERALSALIKWIRKLRWIGMETEAEKLHIVLVEFTQRTGQWSVVGLLDCAIPTRSSQLHPSYWRQTQEPLDKDSESKSVMKMTRH
jgi:hypothetical protein